MVANEVYDLICDIDPSVLFDIAKDLFCDEEEVIDCLNDMDAEDLCNLIAGELESRESSEADIHEMLSAYGGGE